MMTAPSIRTTKINVAPISSIRIPGSTRSDDDKPFPYAPVELVSTKPLDSRRDLSGKSLRQANSKKSLNDVFIVDIDQNDDAQPTMLANHSSKPERRTHHKPPRIAFAEAAPIVNEHKMERPIVVMKYADNDLVPSVKRQSSLLSRLRLSIFGSSTPAPTSRKYSVDDDLPKGEQLRTPDDVEELLEKDMPPNERKHRASKRKRVNRMDSDQITDLLIKAAQDSINQLTARGLEKILSARRSDTKQTNNDRVVDANEIFVRRLKSASNEQKKKSSPGSKSKSFKVENNVMSAGRRSHKRRHQFYTLQHMKNAMDIEFFDYATEALGANSAPYKLESGIEKLVEALTLRSFRKTTSQVRRDSIEEWKAQGIFASIRKRRSANSEKRHEHEPHSILSASFSNKVNE